MFQHKKKRKTNHVFMDMLRHSQHSGKVRKGGLGLVIEKCHEAQDTMCLQQSHDIYLTLPKVLLMRQTDC